MDTPDLAGLFLGPLEAADRFTYMVSGSVASIEYGEPRATLDIDLVLLLEVADLPVLAALFPEPDFYIPPDDVLAIEATRPTRGHFNIIHIPSGLKADCYTSRNHPFLPWALRNRRRVDLDSLSIWLAPPEYVILWKLEFLRESGGDKHRRDITGMLQISGSEIDHSFLEAAIRELGLSPTWESVLPR